MRIEVVKNLVEFYPENTGEKEQLQTLWRTLVDCARFNKKIVPVGQYIPQQDEYARFAIEGLKSDSTDEFPEIRVDKDCRAFCQTCNKYVMLKKGDRIPPCCGKLMEIMD